MAPTTSTTCPTIVLSTWRLRINSRIAVKKLVEAEGKEEGTEAIALRDAILQEGRAQGSQPTCAVVAPAACGIRPIEKVERR